LYIAPNGPGGSTSASSGTNTSTFKAAVRRIAAACNAHGKLARGSAETEAQIEEYWQLGCRVLNLPGNDVSTYLDGMKARAGRAHEQLKSIGVPTP
jgi:2-keto-3-deoxy-L-rhamnonate aldolase RhmA